MLRHLHISPGIVKHLLDRSGVLAHPKVASGIAVGAALAGTFVWLWIRSHRPSDEELERRRRESLAMTGRLTDGTLTEARTLSGEESHAALPEVLLYRYRIAGVTYDCAQDVSRLPERTAGYRLDQPIQVRYDPRNPGNSIVAAEQWTGLRLW